MGGEDNKFDIHGYLHPRLYMKVDDMKLPHPCVIYYLNDTVKGI